MKDNKVKKPFHETKDFKELQLKWYKKLDSSGFNDIERTGPERQVRYNEYTSYLDGQSITYLKRAIDQHLPQLHQLLRKFYWNGRSLAKIWQFLDENDIYYDEKLKKLHKLSNIDLIILRLYNEGATLTRISNYLRSRCTAPDVRPGYPGQAYSVFFVHTHLKRLIKIAKLWALYERETDTTEAAESEAWGVLKTGFGDTVV